MRSRQPASAADRRTVAVRRFGQIAATDDDHDVAVATLEERRSLGDGRIVAGGCRPVRATSRGGGVALLTGQRADRDVGVPGQALVARGELDERDPEVFRGPLDP